MYVDAGVDGLVPAAGGPAAVTVTATGPPGSAGAITVTDVPPGSWDTTVAGRPPNATVGVPGPNPDPVITTRVPPTPGPDGGLSPVTVGQPEVAPVSRDNRAPARGLPHPVARS